jgi:RNA polymerase sigma-70 factor, ECF subfamily
VGAGTRRAPRFSRGPPHEAHRAIRTQTDPPRAAGDSPMIDGVCVKHAPLLDATVEKPKARVNPSSHRIAPVAPGADETDAALVSAAREGNAGACFRICSKYAPLVSRLVGAYFGPGAERDDLAQEVFLRVFSRIGDVRDPRALRGFIAGICLGVARNTSRRARIRSILRLSPRGDLPDIPIPGIEDEARQTLRHLWRLLSSASGEDRSLFVCRHVEKMEMSDVAAAHGMNIVTAKRRVARMTSRISAAMQQDAVLADYAGKLLGKDR